MQRTTARPGRRLKVSRSPTPSPTARATKTEILQEPISVICEDHETCPALQNVQSKVDPANKLTIDFGDVTGPHKFKVTYKTVSAGGNIAGATNNGALTVQNNAAVTYHFGDKTRLIRLRTKLYSMTCLPSGARRSVSPVAERQCSHGHQMDVGTQAFQAAGRRKRDIACVGHPAGAPDLYAGQDDPDR